MIRYTITAGTPTVEELAALEETLKEHYDGRAKKRTVKSVWAKPQLRVPLTRKA